MYSMLSGLEAKWLVRKGTEPSLVQAIGQAVAMALGLMFIIIQVFTSYLAD